ncbi:MAG: histidine phosphatase family protein [Chloroflexi bacterium]|nr:histidine phosphatase family protein [Chloroflexota bacterium]
MLAKRRHTRARILLVGHGGTFFCMLPSILANVTTRFAARHPLAHCDVIIARLDSTALTCERWGNQGFR